MTDRSRIRFYLPAWTRAWRRLRALTTLPEPSTVPDQLLHQVWQVAARSTEPRRDDAFRHACHVVALGRDPSSKTMTAGEADRVVLLFRLLADPEDLGAMMKWEQGTGPDRNRLLWAIRNCGYSPHYVGAIAEDKFGEPDPARLSPQQLHDLVRTLAGRARARERRACHATPTAP